MFGAFMIQGFYNHVHKLNSKGIAVQAYADLPQVINDYRDGMAALKFIDINDYGPNDDWILNKNIEDPDQSITEKQA